MTTSIPGALFDWPRKVQVQTINLCNYSCGSCPYPVVSRGRDKQLLERSILTRIIDDTRAAGRRIELCLMLQNEPLLDARFTDFLGEAHDADDVVDWISTVTNGSTLTEQRLDELTRFSRLRLTVSVNANDADSYREVHGVDRWKKIVDVLEAWDGPRERVRLSFLVSRGSLEASRTFMAHWESAGYRTRLVPLFSRSGFLTIRTGERIAEDSFGHCHYPVDTLSVLADGTITLCCHDWVRATNLGNLHERSVGEIWCSDEFRRIRRAAIAGEIQGASRACAGCDYPLRSTVRAGLERLALGADASHGEHLSIHTARVRIGERTADVVVFHIDRDAGSIWCATRDPLDAIGGAGTFCLSIAHGERFVFGSLSDFWCPAEIVATNGHGADGWSTIRVDLQRDAEPFQLFDWYASDWTLPVATTRPQEAR